MGQDVRDTIMGQDVRDTIMGQDIRDTIMGQDFRDTTVGQDVQDITVGQDVWNTIMGQEARDTAICALIKQPPISYSKLVELMKRDYFVRVIRLLHLENKVCLTDRISIRKRCGNRIVFEHLPK